MQYFWKQNKVFVLSLGAMLVVVLLWWTFVLGPIHTATEELKSERATAESDLQSKMAGGVATEDMLTRAQKDLDRTRDLVKALLTDGAYVEKEPFKPIADKEKDQFSDLNLTKWREIKESAMGRRVGVTQNTSPFPTIPNASPAVAREMLARLAVMDRLCKLAIDAGVDRIDKVNPMPDLETDKIADGSVKAQFLNVLPVKVTVTGSSAQLFQIVHALSKKGEGFIAVTGFSATKANEHADSWSCDIEAAALVVDEKLPVVMAPRKDE